MQIQVSYDSSVTGATGIETTNPTYFTEYTAAVQTAVNFFDNLISNALTVSITFGWGQIPTTSGTPSTVTSLGASSSYIYNTTWGALEPKLAAAYGSASANAWGASVQAAANATLTATSGAASTAGLTNDTAFTITTAEAAMLGFDTTNYTIGGSIGVAAPSATMSWGWTQATTSGSAYDLVGTIEHEISESLGRGASGGVNNDYGIMDLFRYTAAAGDTTTKTADGVVIANAGGLVGARYEPFANPADTTTPTSPQTYFSFDGTTITNPFETGANASPPPSGNGNDVADWYASVPNDNVADGAADGADYFTTTDQQVMAALGYQINTTITNAQQLAMACFVTGTLIATPRGPRAVEDLQAGDEVLTPEGEARPISWMGKRTVSARFADPLTCWPIRIRAGALADNVPSRDLLVSPDHAMFVDGVLIHAGALVNGSSIAREQRVPSSFCYYHVEVEDHALILAEGAPTETFIDNVDRMSFDNWNEHEALFPMGKPMAELPYPRAKAQRQVPSAVKTRLALRAAKITADERAA